nr:outer envelope pore protein 16-4, chloroplastic [Tanacetum cinerariifolium]
MRKMRKMIKFYRERKVLGCVVMRNCTREVYREIKNLSRFSKLNLELGPVCCEQKGLTGIDRASFVAKTVGKYGFQCGLFAGIFSFTRCGIGRYRKKNDWVNALVAGGVAGAAIGAGTRNWKQVAGQGHAGSVSEVRKVLCMVGYKGWAREDGEKSSSRKMDAQWYNDVPCSSIAVESIISVGTGGLIWGSCAGNYDAKQK